MKVIWFRLLTLTLALASSGVSAVAQYPSNGNVGPSSFPIAQPNLGQQGQVGLLNLPQVPSSYAPQQQMNNMQLTGMQEVVPAPSSPPMAPVPQVHSHQPMTVQQGVQVAPQAGCQSCGQNTMGYQAPMQYAGPAVSYQSTLAPNCTTCGPAPVSQIGVPAYSGFTAAAPTYGGGFGGRIGGLPNGAKPYFGGGGFLLFNRVDDKSRPLALYDASGLDALSTGDAQMGAMPGFEVMFGRYFNCGRNAIAASYWGIFSDTEMAQITGGTAGELRSRILSSGDVHMPIDPTGATTPYDVYDWYDSAWTHRVRRSSDYQNVEINLLGFSVGGASRNFNRPTAGTLFSGHHGAGHSGCGYCGGAGCGACGSSCGTSACAPSPRYATGPTGYIGPNCGSRLNLSWLAGVRYFRFEDFLEYAASFNNDGINRTVDDIYYENRVVNEMVGFQIGGRGDYCLGKRFNLYTNGKVGVYGNQASLASNLYNDFGTAYQFGVPTNSYAIDVNETRVAFLSEFGTGVGVRVSPKWTATFGYRAVIASGVATAVGNLRHPGDLPRDQACIDLDSTLILHGFNVGALYNF